MADITDPTAMLALFGAMMGVIITVGIALYIYMALAWMTIGKKLKHKYPWLAWIPGANFALMLDLGKFHWALVFLLLIPVVGWIALGVLLIIATWRVYEKRKYPGWLALLGLAGFIPFVGILASIASIVVLGLVAWADR